MDTLTLQPSKAKWLMTLLGAGGAFYGGISMIQQGQTSAGWCCVIFFGMITLFSISMLIPGMNGVFLTPEGFSLKAMGRTQAVWKIKWRDVTGFSVVDIRPRNPKAIVPPAPMKMVGINFTPEARAEMPGTASQKWSAPGKNMVAMSPCPMHMASKSNK